MVRDPPRRRQACLRAVEDVRGAAAILAAAAAWIIVTGRIPTFKVPVFNTPSVPVLAISAVAGVAGGSVAYGLLAAPVAAATVGLFVAVAPVAMEQSRRRKRREAVAAAWPDVLARVRSRVTAGSTLTEALLDGLTAAPPPLCSATERIDDAVRFGPGFEQALDDLRNDLADPIADRILVTVSVAHRSGGRRVGEVLSALSISVADELRLRRAHEAAMTEQRMTAAVALIAPWALLVLAIATNPQAAVAYRSPSGAVVITIGLIGTGAGYLLARRSARLAQTPRVFE